MLKVLIADDEKIVLNGLKSILPWDELGLSLCDTASDGQEALTKILELQPDIVLIDISMPTFNGLEVIKYAREMNFKGQFIILSGYTKFEYAQQAMQYNVNYYLTKPIDRDNLLEILKELIDKNLISKKSQTKLNFLEKNQREQIIKNILTKPDTLPSNIIEQYNLTQGPYQVVLFLPDQLEKNNETISFASLLNINNLNYDYFEEVSIDTYRVYLLKNKALKKLKILTNHNKPYAPDLSGFLAFGQIVTSLDQINSSYIEAKEVITNRFFLPTQTRFASIADLNRASILDIVTEKTYLELREDIYNCILLQKNLEINSLMLSLQDNLTFSNTSIKEIRYGLIDFYLAIKHQVLNNFPEKKIPVIANPQIIFFINTHSSLDGILSLLQEQFLLMARTVGIVSNKSIIDGVTFYIEQNYRQNLTLEQLSEIFNYNSSYLGKLFTKSVGINFNQYLDQIRIKQAKHLLQNPNIKIYEVAEQVGYKNVDYFYKKFRAIEHKSPAKYRNQLAT